MQRNAVLVRQKYLEYLGSTMGFIISLYLANIADGIIVSQLLGTAAFAAINLTLPVYHVRNILFFILVDGGSILAAQFIGSRDRESCNKVFTITFAGGVIALGVLGLLGCFLAGPTAEFLAAGSSLTELTYDYLVPLWLTGPLLILTNGLSSYLRLEGEHKLAIAIPVFANIANLIFDYIFIAVCGWGIAGAGWATGVGYACSLLLVIPYWRKQDRSWHIVSLGRAEQSLCKRILLVGLPLAMIPLGLVIRSFVINNLALDKLGDMGAMTISLCNAALLYALMFADGASITLGNVCGVLYGEMDKQGAIKVLSFALRLTQGLCCLIFVWIAGFPEVFVSLYGVTENAITAELLLYLRVNSLYILVMAPVFILRAYYQSIGQEISATIFSLLEGVLLIVPLLYGLAAVSLTFMWAAPAVAATLSLIWLIRHMKQKSRALCVDNFLLLSNAEEGNVWETTIKATITTVARAVEEVETFCASHEELDSKQSYAAQLTVEELCVNIVEHSGLGEQGSIDIFAKITPAGVVIKVRDMGSPFNPVKFLDESGEEFSGLLMVRKLTTNIEYARILGFNTTIVTIGKRK